MLESYENDDDPANANRAPTMDMKQTNTKNLSEEGGMGLTRHISGCGDFRTCCTQIGAEGGDSKHTIESRVLWSVGR